MVLRAYLRSAPGGGQAAGDTQPEQSPEEDISISGETANAIPGVDDDTDRGLVSN